MVTRVISRMVDGKRVHVQETLTAQEEVDHEVDRAAGALSEAIKNKVGSLKVEAMSRIKARIPGVDSIDQLNLIKEFWLSIAPAARAPTSDFQYVIDVYQVAKDELGVINAMGEATAVDAYDVINTPSWPV